MSTSAETDPADADQAAPWGGDPWDDCSDGSPGEDVELTAEDLRDLYGDGDYCGDGRNGDEDWPGIDLHPPAFRALDPGSAVAARSPSRSLPPSPSG